MSLNFIWLIAVAVAGALSVAFFVKMVLWVLRDRKNPAPPPPPMPTALSFLAGLSFFSGLAAIGLVVAAAILFATLSMGDLLQMNTDARETITVAAKIVLYVSLLPSVVAVAFALAARGVISESGGVVRGRPLYRTGVLLAVLSGAVVFDARVLNPSTWASALKVENFDLADEREGRGYLGIELEGPGSCRVVRVVPGSPAERAGIQSGDRILHFNGSPTTTGAALTDRIGSHAPGSQVVLGLQRGTGPKVVTAELVAAFGTLHGMLKRQTFDQERLHILKAAGVDHRYSADELTKICATFEADAGRVTAIERALPFLQDPQNAYRILGALEFSPSKEKVSGWIAERAKAPKPSKDE